MRVGAPGNREGGFTLIELLFAIVVLGFAMRLIVDGMTASVRSSDLRNKQATVETVLRNFAEAVKAADFRGADITTITGEGVAPIRVTAAIDGLQNGDAVWVRGVAGNTKANGVWIVAGSVGSTFDLIRRDAGGNPVNSEGVGAGGAGGSAMKLPSFVIPDGYVAAIDDDVGCWISSARRYGNCGPDVAEPGLKRLSLKVTSPSALLGRGSQVETLDIVRRAP